MVSSPRRFLNPMNVIKAIYEVFGAPHPMGSFIVVVLLCAFLGGGFWIFARRQYEKEHPPAQRESRVGRTQDGHTPSVMQAQAVASGYSSDVTFDCPESVSLRISQQGNGFTAVFTKHGIKATSGPFRLSMSNYRTFSQADLDWREPMPFEVELGRISILRPGHHSDALMLILAHKYHLEIGNRAMNEILVWPPADSSSIQRYRLGLEVHGLATEWNLDLCVRWERGTDKVEFMRYSDTIPTAQF